MQAVLTIWEKKQAQARVDVKNKAKRREKLEAEMKAIVNKMKVISSTTALKFMEEDLMKLEQEITNLDTEKEEVTATEIIDMPAV